MRRTRPPRETGWSAIATAETNYATRHPDRGYACTLAIIFAPEPGAMPGENGFVYDPGQGNEEWSGYRFALMGCDGSPAARSFASLPCRSSLTRE